MRSRPAVWLRWATVHGVPRAFLTVRARRGEPLARLILGRGDRLALIEEIRAAGPLMRTPVVWATADYDVCRTVLRDNDFGVADPSETGLPDALLGLIRRVDPGLPNPVEPPAMLMTDPPQHTEYRKLVSRSFTPRSIAALDTRIGELTAELLDDLGRRREVDLIADYAAQLPAAVISRMLGVPDEDRARILGWGETGAALLDIGIGWRPFRAAIDGLVDVDTHLGAHFRRLHQNGADGTPFSSLALDGSLSGRELISNAALLVGAGVETTVNLIGNGIAALLDHPDQLALLRDDPGLWPSAVEEILRYDSPVQMTARTAHRDTEIAGVGIRKGAVIVMLLGGANRDPKVFDRPQTFDITRANARDHLAFASGIHVCLGAALARIEGATALRELFTRYPDLHLTAPAEPRDLVTLHGYRHLPVRLGRAATATRRAS
ncbi:MULTISPECIES: cytochrome P450 [Mycolicibacterium]|jgi:cytochrome P450|uniref:Steroid C26-monooxygenase n=2 Tax=Mycolicibacterium TaxID=1866885 RepID=A1TGJ1_MYCVP|nr:MULTISPECIES: cytochrome P450 [Mycolicibacterium]ABM16291.1 cytochrome P450 [Mycolicibacterium vanbaalenii PYR-1]MCV7128105.1 cytochrome P450 [Mycolicibacterium vanbaalenii PYR-1]MDN4519525.1 cytochrome P450 [Mycolicibacterium austroafricanum]MDW5614584.1 cytochrome P450 [Mycolicibacterium sp. D5.8-2]QZT56663.1 cytochrome P450 [Mycolicibacterium austroafricanum]